jgi:copper homeostasis protein
MSVFLEVIVTSIEEAIAAERGGADRLELVRDLNQGGLTPSCSLVEEVVASVKIPVRVMVREADSMQITDAAEKSRLQRSIQRFSEYPIDGLVLGFLKEGQVDTCTLTDLLPHDLKCNVTFHRAFDETADGVCAIEVLKLYRQIDRILTTAGQGSWSSRRARLDQWQSLSAPEIQMLFSIGRDTSQLSELHGSPRRYEVHVGRAARISHVNSGAVSEDYVAALKNNSSDQCYSRDQP